MRVRPQPIPFAPLTLPFTATYNLATLFLNLHGTTPETLTRFATAVGYALQVLHAEKEPLAELERVVASAMAGLEGLTEEQAGQWVRVAWYLALLVYHRRERQEYDELVQVIVEQAKASKFRERGEVEQVGQSMAQAIAAEAEARGEARGITIGEARGEARVSERALRASVQTVLEARFGELSSEVKTALSKADTKTLTSWLRFAATAATLDEIGIATSVPPVAKSTRKRSKPSLP